MRRAFRQSIPESAQDLGAAGLRPRLHPYKRVAAIRILLGAVFAVDAFLKWRPASPAASKMAVARAGRDAGLALSFGQSGHEVERCCDDHGTQGER
jgi:hypothetical protein